MALFGAPRVRLDPTYTDAPSNAVLDPRRRAMLETTVQQQLADRHRPSFGPRREAAGAQLQQRVELERKRFRDLAKAVGLPWLDAGMVDRYFVTRATDPAELERLNAFLAHQHALQERIRHLMLERGAVIHIIVTETCFARQQQQPRGTKDEPSPRRYLSGIDGGRDAGHHNAKDRQHLKSPGLQSEYSSGSDDEASEAEDNQHPSRLRSPRHHGPACSEASHRRLCSLLYQHDQRCEEIAQALQEWRAGLNRPLPFLVDGENILFTIRGDAQSVIYPAQLHLLPCRDRDYFYTSGFVTMIGDAARHFVADEASPSYVQEDAMAASMSRHATGSGTSSPKSASRAGSPRNKDKHQHHGRAKKHATFATDPYHAVPGKFSHPAEARGGEPAFASDDVAASLRYCDVTGGLPVALLRPLPLLEDDDAHAPPLAEAPKARITVADQTAAALAANGSPTKLLPADLPPPPVRRRRSTLVGTGHSHSRRSTVFVGDRNARALQHSVLIADIDTSLSLGVKVEDLLVDSDEEEETLERLGFASRVATFARRPPGARRPTLYAGASPATLRSSCFAPSEGSLRLQPSTSGDGSRARSFSFTAFPDDDGSMIHEGGSFRRSGSASFVASPARAVSSFFVRQSASPAVLASQTSMSAVEPHATYQSAPQLVDAEVETQQGYVGEMLLRTSQGRAILAMRIQDVVDFPLVVDPAKSHHHRGGGGATDDDDVRHRHRHPRSAARTPTPAAAVSRTTAGGGARAAMQLRSSTPGGGPGRHALGAPPAQNRGSGGGTALVASLPRRRKDAGAPQKPRRQSQQHLPPLLGPVTTGSAPGAFRREAHGKGALTVMKPPGHPSVHQQLAANASTILRRREAAALPPPMAAPVDEYGAFYVDDVAALDWVAQCFTHARQRIDDFSRRAALGDHAFAIIAAHRSAGREGQSGRDDDIDDEELLEALLDGGGHGSAVDEADAATVDAANGDEEVMTRAQSSTAQRHLLRQQRTASILVQVQAFNLRRSFFRRWVKRTLRSREMARLAQMLLVHTNRCTLYVSVRTWRAVCQRREVLRKRSRLLAFSVLTQARRNTFRHWRTSALLTAISRGINEKLYARGWEALKARAALRRATAGSVAAAAVASAVRVGDGVPGSSAPAATDDPTVNEATFDGSSLRVVCAMASDFRHRSLHLVTAFIPEWSVNRVEH